MEPRHERRHERVRWAHEDENPALPSHPVPVLEPDLDTSTETAAPWQVIVWDDPVNHMSYVVWVFQKLFGFSREVATSKMMEVHHQGRSIVLSTDREEGEVAVGKLHAHGLQATLERAEG